VEIHYPPGLAHPRATELPSLSKAQKLKTLSTLAKPPGCYDDEAKDVQQLQCDIPLRLAAEDGNHCHVRKAYSDEDN